MRLFLAIDLPKKNKEQLVEQLAAFKIKHPDYSWVDPDKYHLTLHYFGEVADEKKVAEKIGETIYDQEKFYLFSGNLDLFMKNKITIYLGFRREKKLENLVEKVKEKFQIRDDKKYVPHLTVAKWRIPSKQQYFVLQKLLGRQEIDLEIAVKRVTLYASILNGSTSVYKKIKSYELL